MSDPGDELLDETTLRRALRLEADERPPRFDPAAIAAVARRPRLALVSALVALGLGAVGAVAVWSAVAIFLPTLAADAFDLALGVLALLVVPLSAIAGVAQQPVVPLSLIAAIAIATLHELRESRVGNVSAS
ncbi:MAG TPA: hypothetical protein VGR85_01685 [Candidatus Limnocylindria bacterium]|jgi:hypothetical protein|nr:hypothetical protein [Candidatus Limnocylindria bacterium]